MDSGGYEASFATHMIRPLRSLNVIGHLLFWPALVFLTAFFMWILRLAEQSWYIIAYVLLGLMVLFSLTRPSGKGLGRVTRVLSRRDRLLDWLSITNILWLAFVLRLAWALLARPPLASDFANFYDLTAGFLAGKWEGLGSTKSPITILWYSMFFKLTGQSMLVLYFSNALVGLLQVFFVYRIALEIYDSRSAAKLAALIVAVFPSLVTYSSLMSSEMPFVVLLLAMIWVGLRVLRKTDSVRVPRIADFGMGLGLLAAGLHMTRNTGVFYAVWLMFVLVVLASLRWKQKGFLVGIFVATTLVCFAPQIRYNYETYGSISINSSPWGWLSLLYGTNMYSMGTFSQADKELIGETHAFTPEEVDAASAHAREIALERIRKDVSGFFRFALTEKAIPMWVKDEYGVIFSWTHETPLVPFSNRFYWLFILVTAWALLFVPWQSRAFRNYVSIVGGIVFITVVLHLFFEVQGRYHFFLPFLTAVLTGAILNTPCREDVAVDTDDSDQAT